MGCDPSHHFISLQSIGAKKSKLLCFDIFRRTHPSSRFFSSFAFLSFFLTCLCFWSCIEPPKPESSSGKNLPRVKRALNELHHQRVAKKAASELKDAYLSTQGWRRYLLGLLMIGDTIKKAESPHAPPPDSLWVLARVLENQALPLLKSALEKALPGGAGDTFVAASLEIAHLSDAPKTLLEGALVSDITGHYFKSARELTKRYGCKGLSSDISTLLRADSTVFPDHSNPNLIILLQNIGLSHGFSSRMLFSSLWRLAVFLGCSEFAPIVSRKLQAPSSISLSSFVVLSRTAAHLPSSTGLTHLRDFLLSEEKVSSKDLEPKSRSHNSGQLIKKAVAFSAVGWTRSPSKELSSLILKHLQFSTADNNAKNTTSPELSFFVRSLLLSMNRIGEPKELPLLQEIKENLPKSLHPLLKSVEKTLLAMGGRDKKILIQLSKNGSIYERERALLELGRKKSPLEETDVIKKIAVHPYLSKAYRTASRWQNMPN